MKEEFDKYSDKGNLDKRATGDNIGMLREEFDKYFVGELYGSEKRIFFDKIEADEELKSEFIDMQKAVALTKLYPQKEDDAMAVSMMADLDKRIKRKYNRKVMLNITKYAAVVAILIINAWLLVDRTKPAKEDELAYTTIEVPKGQRISMTLQDGTQAFLSPRSVMRISNRFNKEERVIELDGEGYFAVEKNDKKPFIVRTGQHNVKVLGTRFNVFAYSQSHRFETDLLEGKVEVSDQSAPLNFVVLNPREKVTLVDNKLIKSVSHFNNDEYLKNGIFSFSNKPFSEVLEYLSLWYDIKFDIKKSVNKNLPVSGKFRQSDEVKKILSGLQGIGMLSFKYKEIDEHLIEIY